MHDFCKKNVHINDITRSFYCNSITPISVASEQSWIGVYTGTEMFVFIENFISRQTEYF